MAEFKIYQSEFSVRAENVRLRRELDANRAEITRLRAKAGEAPLAQSAQALQPVNDEFKAGNCTVKIGAAPGVAPVTTPLPVAAPRVARPRVIAAPRPRMPAVARATGAVLSFAMDGDKAIQTSAPTPTPAPPGAYQPVIDVEAEQVQTVGSGNNGVDTDDASLRFSMLEL